MTDKHKIAIVFDVPSWAFHRRAKALQKYAPADFDVTIMAMADVDWHVMERQRAYDLVFLIDYSQASYFSRRLRERGGTGASVPLVVSHNKDSRSKRDLWPASVATWTIVNNMDSWEFHGRQPNTCCISNGIDADLWQPRVPIAEREHRVLWCGSTGKSKHKGYDEVLLPLQYLLEPEGFTFDFRPINTMGPHVYDEARQAQWYNSGSYVLCAAGSEGTPNTSLEGLACGCVLVTTAVGNSPEFGRDRENCVFAERDARKFADALLYAREHRERLSAAGASTMQGWTYGAPGNRAAYFFGLFRRLLLDGADSIKPFSYAEIAPEGI